MKWRIISSRQYTINFSIDGCIIIFIGKRSVSNWEQNQNDLLRELNQQKENIFLNALVVDMYILLHEKVNTLIIIIAKDVKHL
jgi:hypothetical protein